MAIFPTASRSLVKRYVGTLSKLKLDGLKLDSKNYLHIDEVTSRAKEVLRAFTECVNAAIELVVARQVRGERGESDKNPIDYACELFLKKWEAIWTMTKTGRERR